MSELPPRHSATHSDRIDQYLAAMIRLEPLRAARIEAAKLEDGALRRQPPTGHAPGVGIRRPGSRPGTARH